MEDSNKEAYILVAAIDFGTCLSGYAYSDVKESTTDRVNWVFPNWHFNGRTNCKTLTCILFNEDRQFDSFGHEALKNFVQLQKEKKNVYFFQRFKMELYSKEKLNNLQLKDVQGKHMSAKHVFACSIKALKNELLEQLKKSGKDAKESEIRWVLTVPAIWSEDAKIFMRECAYEAELPKNQLHIALEPESASINCQYIRMVRGAVGGFKVTDPGTRYIVVDVGGGTTDITIHEKNSEGGLNELLPATGEGVGGSSIESKLVERLDGIFENNLFQRLKDEKISLYTDLIFELEEAKKTIKQSQQGMVPVRIPLHTLNNILAKQNKTLENIIEMKMSGKLGDEKIIELDDEKLYIHVNVIKNVFNPITSRILKSIKTVVGKTTNISYIILVGGFAESELLQEKVKKYFEPKIKVVVPDDASIAVLKGAVLYGHNPTSVSLRQTRFTYGVRTNGFFDPQKHDSKRITTDDFGNTLCRDCFDLIVCKNTCVPLGKSIRKTYNSTKKLQTSIGFYVYSSEDTNPLYTDDGNCREIGTFIVELPSPTETRRNVEVQFIFYDTELKIKTKELLYGGEIEIDFKLV